MNGILVLTHGPFGEHLLRSACAIMNEPEKAAALNISRRLDFTILRNQIVDKIKELDAEAGVLVLIDAYGGTAYNTALPLIKTHPIHIVTGVNLPMVLSALTNRHRMPLEALARKVAEDARKTISVLADSFVGK